VVGDTGRRGADSVPGTSGLMATPARPCKQPVSRSWSPFHARLVLGLGPARWPCRHRACQPASWRCYTLVAVWMSCLRSPWPASYRNWRRRPSRCLPFWRTATPVRFDTAGLPFSRTVYVTLACVADISVTLVTFADAWAARLELAWDLMVAAKRSPSCSRLVRRATGVLGLKKAVQFASMADSSELWYAARTGIIGVVPAVPYPLAGPPR
jgi:hypothetical protein